MGYLSLKSADVEGLLDNSNRELVGYQKFNKDVGHTILGTPVNVIFNLNYYHVQDTDLTVITTPLQAFQYEEMLRHLNTYFSKNSTGTQRILCALIGHGATENHIVTAYYSAASQTVQIFDPKVSDATKFFAQATDSRVSTLLSSLWRAIKPNPKQQISIQDPIQNEKTIAVEYISLGTQSFFDPSTCGYHSAATIKICQSILQEGKELTREEILARTGNPVSEGYSTIKNSPSADKVQITYLDFLKKAWADTYMPLLDDKQRKETPFIHYFLGWPQETGSASKISYFTTLSFIVIPFINTLIRPMELLFNFASENASYFKNRLMNWAPTHFASQYFRSGLLLLTYGLQGIFKLPSLILGSITTSIISFEDSAREAADTVVKYYDELAKTEEKITHGSNVAPYFQTNPTIKKEDDLEDDDDLVLITSDSQNSDSSLLKGPNESPKSKEDFISVSSKYSNS